MLVRIIAVCLLAAGCGRLSFDERPPTADDGGGTGDASRDGGEAMPGCQAGETSAAQTESFDTSLPVWANVYGGSEVAIANGGMELSPIPGQGTVHYAGIIENPGSDHRGQRLLIEVPQMIPARAGVQVLFRVSSLNADDWTQFYVETDRLHAETRAGGPGIGVTVDYDPVTHRWWQLREAGGVVELETSPDGLAWTTLHSIATPPYYASGGIEIAAGYYLAQSMPLGTVRFDNLFVCE